MQATQSSRPILTLPQDVVNKIAAGEVVVRPMNAVKELIENSLDAGATEIMVTCKNGGLDMIRVKDNGCGISQADYERVCERFATSKLKTAADLQNVSTFGFRGEALASISCMSKVQIVSRSKEATHAWSAQYKNCKPLAKPKISPGLVGTQITAEKLFEDYPQRRSMFSRPQDEAVGIASVLIKYAINFPDIKFSYVRDDGANRSGGSFSSQGKGDQHAAIRLLMPSNLTKDLFDFEVSSEKYMFSAKICMASPLSSFTSTAIKAKNEKQKIFQLFINNRLITCTKLKQVIDTAFSTQDAYCPFMTVSMQIEPSRIDCNVHPTKELVCFLDEVKIGDIIQNKLFEVMDNFRQNGIIELNRVNSSSTIKTTPKMSQQPLYDQPSTSQTPSPVPMSAKVKKQPLSCGKKRKSDDSENSNDSIDLNFNAKSTIKMAKKSSNNHYIPLMATAFQKILAAPNQMVRVDSRNHSMDEFMNPNTSFLNQTVNSLPPDEISFYEEVLDETTMNASILSCDQNEETIDLTSNEIDDVGKYAFKALDEIRDQNSTYLTGLVRNFVLTGFVDVYHVVFQSDNSIYMVELMPVLEEMFYQRCLKSIGKFSGRRLILNCEKSEYDGFPLVSMVDTYLIDFPKAKLPNSNKFENKKDVVDELIMNVGKPENIKRLWSEFGIKMMVDEKVGPVISMILTHTGNYVPLLSEQMARFGYELICVDWEMPETATKQIVRAISRLYTPYQIFKCSENSAKYQCDMINCQLLSLMKTEFLVPEKLRPCFTKLLSTFDAFKIFGRC